MIRRFFAALTMLTILPVPGFSAKEGDLEKCKLFFPVVGLITGGLTGLAAWLLLSTLSKGVAVVAMVLFMVLLSKNFHLDGLADTADGFMSSRPRERILEIMHDSHIGTMGVFAIFAVLGLQIAALMALPSSVIPFAAGGAALSGRCIMVFYISISNYARESGLGKAMFHHKSLTECLVTAAIWYGAAWFLFGCFGLICATALLLLAPLWAIYTRMKIGGATGDTIGACEILTETLWLLVLNLACVSHLIGISAN